MMDFQRNNHSDSVVKRKNRELKRKDDESNRKMTGLLSQLTKEQRYFLLNYDGEEVSGCFYNEDIK